MSNVLFEVEDLITHTISVSHGTKLKLFHNKGWSISEEITEHLSYQNGEYCIIDELLDVRKKQGTIQILVRWEGFDDEDP